MFHTIVRFRVKEFEQWRAEFASHFLERKASGSKGGDIFREQDDQHAVILLLEWDDPDHARTFFGSPEFRESLQHSGVTEEPEVLHLVRVALPSA
jgi:quinol monooxygenase YgiN